MIEINVKDKKFEINDKGEMTEEDKKKFEEMSKKENEEKEEE